MESLNVSIDILSTIVHMKIVKECTMGVARARGKTCSEEDCKGRD